MASISLQSLSVPDLVAQFIDIASEQERAELEDNHRRMRALYWKMDAVKVELKGRNGDGRHSLVPLLTHGSVQVRMKAALATLAIAPEPARAVLTAIAKYTFQPQALEAGMALWGLDQGIFKPN